MLTLSDDWGYGVMTTKISTKDLIRLNELIKIYYGEENKPLRRRAAEYLEQRASTEASCRLTTLIYAAEQRGIYPKRLMFM